MTSAAAIVNAIEIYAWIGLAVAIAFLGVGVDRVEHSARGSYLFRVLLIPGVMLLWPIVAVRWITLERGNVDWRARHAPRRRLHRRAWMLLAVLIPAILVTSLLARKDGPRERPALQLAPPTQSQAAIQ